MIKLLFIVMAFSISAEAKLNRLTNYEIKNLYRSVLDKSTFKKIIEHLDGLPHESYINDQSFYSEYTEQHVKTFALIAQVAQRNFKFPNCKTQIAKCKALLQKAFRRPPTDKELKRYKNIKQVLLSPHFLFLGMNKNHPYRIAEEISFLTTGDVPDDTLYAIAAKDSFDKATISKQIRRMIQSEKGKNQMYRFTKYWVGMELSTQRCELEIKDKKICETANAELKDFIVSSIFSDDKKFYDMFANQKLVSSDKNLLAYLGIENKNSTQFVGPMARPAIFINGTFRGIIKRGATIQKEFLCNKIPQPNLSAVNSRKLASLDRHQPKFHNERQKIEHLTKEPQCMACHKAINSTGGKFENYDKYGRITNGNSNRLIQFSQQVGKMEQAQNCFNKKFHQFFSKFESEGSYLMDEDKKRFEELPLKQIVFRNFNAILQSRLGDANAIL